MLRYIAIRRSMSQLITIRCAVPMSPRRPRCPAQRQAWLLEQFRLVYTVGYSVSLVSLLLALLLLLLFRYGTPRGHPWVLWAPICAVGSLWG